MSVLTEHVNGSRVLAELPHDLAPVLATPVTAGFGFVQVAGVGPGLAVAGWNQPS